MPATRNCFHCYLSVKMWFWTTKIKLEIKCFQAHQMYESTCECIYPMYTLIFISDCQCLSKDRQCHRSYNSYELSQTSRVYVLEHSFYPRILFLSHNSILLEKNASWLDFSVYFTAATIDHSFSFICNASPTHSPSPVVFLIRGSFCF